jgi:hypothetical protein
LLSNVQSGASNLNDKDFSSLTDEEKRIDSPLDMGGKAPSSGQSSQQAPLKSLPNQATAGIKLPLSLPSEASNGASSSAQPSAGSMTDKMLGLSSTVAGSQAAVTRTKQAFPSKPVPANTYIQRGVMPGYPQQMQYNYDDHHHSMPMMHGMPSPYPHYDASQFQNRDNVQSFPGGDGKFVRGTDSSAAATSLNPQGNMHISGHPQQQAFMNAATHLQYGYAYTYNPNMIPQAPAGVYPFTTTPMYQVNYLLVTFSLAWYSLMYIIKLVYYL